MQEVRRVAEADKNDKRARPDFRSLATFWPYARAQKRRIMLAQNSANSSFTCGALVW